MHTYTCARVHTPVNQQTNRRKDRRTGREREAGAYNVRRTGMDAGFRVLEPRAEMDTVAVWTRNTRRERWAGAFKRTERPLVEGTRGKEQKPGGPLSERDMEKQAPVLSTEIHSTPIHPADLQLLLPLPPVFSAASVESTDCEHFARVNRSVNIETARRLGSYPVVLEKVGLLKLPGIDRSHNRGCYISFPARFSN